MCRLSWILGILDLLEPSGPVQVCNGTALPFHTLIVLTGLEARASSSGCIIQIKTFYRMCFIINYNDYMNILIYWFQFVPLMNVVTLVKSNVKTACRYFGCIETCSSALGSCDRASWAKCEEREKKPTRSNNQMFIVNFYLNMFRA